MSSLVAQASCCNNRFASALARNHILSVWFISHFKVLHHWRQKHHRCTGNTRTSSILQNIHKDTHFGTLLHLTLCRLHLSRAADADDASARLEPITAVVVHAPPFEQTPADDTELDDNVLKGESAVGGLKEENAVVDSSSFSLYSMLKRWNKEGDDTQRLQEFQEQVNDFGS